MNVNSPLCAATSAFFAFAKNSLAKTAGVSLFENFRYIHSLNTTYAVGSNISASYSAVGNALLAEHADTEGYKYLKSSTVGKSVTFVSPDIEDARDLSEWGHSSLNVGFSDTAIDVTDGVYDPSDYTATRVIIPEYQKSTASTTSTVTEHLSHDDKWIYAAYTVTNLNTAVIPYLDIWYTNSPYVVDSSVVGRTQFNYTIVDGGVGSVARAGVHHEHEAGDARQQAADHMGAKAGAADVDAQHQGALPVAAQGVEAAAQSGLA